MGEASRTLKIEELMNYSNNLIELLKQEKDIVDLRHFLHQASSLQSQCDKDLREVQKSIEEIVNTIDDLEREREFVEEQRQTIKKFEQDDTRAQMKLSMYASVTNTIPYLDYPSRISGHILARDKKVVEKFEFDPSKATPFDTCNSIWEMINMS